MSEEYVLYHTQDAGNARNLGERVVSSMIQAILEIVKNAYDADAHKCEVIFEGVQDKLQGILVRKIIIKDNGIGMSFYDLERRWLRIGTTNKEETRISPKGRRLAGEKGMGHFAVQKLGKLVTIISNPLNYNGRENVKHINKTLTLTQDWTKYIPGKDFEKIPNTVIITDRKNLDQHGTTIEIKNLSSKWTVDEIEQLRTTLGGLVKPGPATKDSKEDFVIEMTTPIHTEPLKINDYTSYAPYKLVGRLRGKKVSWTITKRTEGIERKKIEDHSGSRSWYNNKCGDLDVELYHFPKDLKFWRDRDGIGSLPTTVKGKQVSDFIKQMCGVKIYKNEIKVMPYGEPGNDWLDLDTRAFSKLTSYKYHARNNKIIGFVLASDKNDLIETTTRQALIHNDAFKSLAGTPNNREESLMLFFIQKLEEHFGSVDESKKSNLTNKRFDQIAVQKLKQSKKSISQLPIEAEKKAELLKSQTAAIKAINDYTEDYHEELQSVVSAEELYRGLASFGLATLAYEHETGEPIKDLKIIINKLQTIVPQEHRELIARAQKEIRHIQNWRNYVNAFTSMISGTESAHMTRAEISIRDIVDNIKQNLSAMLIFRRGITTDEDKKIKIDFQPMGELKKIFAVPLHFDSIFMNMITNSIKALKEVEREEHRIIIKAEKKGMNLILEFSDNGIGIPDESKDDIWRELWTSYTDPGKRGMGLGLPITKEIVKTDYDGDIKLERTTYEKDESTEGNTTFKIEIPLKSLQR